MNIKTAAKIFQPVVDMMNSYAGTRYIPKWKYYGRNASTGTAKRGRITGGGKKRAYGRFYKKRGRYYPRRKYRKPPFTKKQTRAVKQIVKRTDEDESLNTFRAHDVSQAFSLENECGYSVFLMGSKTQLNAATDNATSVLLTAGKAAPTSIDLNDTTNTSERKILFKNMLNRITLRNNWQSPVNCEVYQFICRDNISSHAYSYFASDLTDKGVTNPGTDPRFNIWDAQKDLRKYWKLFRNTKYLINAGEEIVVTMQRKKPWLYEVSHDTTYIKGITQCTIVRVQGCVAHDSTNSALVGLQPTKLDVYIQDHYKFSTDISSHFKYVIEDSQTLPESVGGYVVSAMEQEQVGYGA